MILDIRKNQVFNNHLGSSSWITTTNGTTVQHLHYLPWGESFVDQRVSSYAGARYTFSAKEKDTETGYSYFGARYYSSDLSIWLSVDPMAGKYPSLSPYVYCADNPIMLVDPNGMTWETSEDVNMAQTLTDQANKKIKQIENQIKRLENKIERYTKNNKNVSEARQLIDSYNQQKSYLQEGVENLDFMGKTTDYVFHFNITDNNSQSNVTQRNKGNSKIIDINIYSGYQFQVAWHECVHVGDWLAGNFEHTFQKGVLGTLNGNHGKAEEHAYKSEFSFSIWRFLEKGIYSVSNINEKTYEKFCDN